MLIARWCKIVLCTTVFIELCSTCGKDFTLLTANTWNMGMNVDHGVAKVARHILAIEADVVALQAIDSDKRFNDLMKALGKGWYSERKENSLAVLSKYPIIAGSRAETPRSLGVRINMTAYNVVIGIWNCWLPKRSYGPYAANNKLVMKDEIFQIGEADPKGGRLQEMKAILGDPSFRSMNTASENEPLFLMGDFNTPSHLDWIAENSKIHGGWRYLWPITLEIQKNFGFTDSYRDLYPNPILRPGITWSPVFKTAATGWEFKFPEPQDRIDYIYYKSKNVGLLWSTTYTGTKPPKEHPYHSKNDFPSDHAWVISKFHYYK